jgi:hypothetical protein
MAAETLYTVAHLVDAEFAKRTLSVSGMAWHNRNIGRVVVKRGADVGRRPKLRP